MVGIQKLLLLCWALLGEVVFRAATVPLIDIAGFSKSAPDVRQKIAHNFSRAFEDFGFVVVTGHGVPDETFDDVYAAGKLFFKQSASEKMRFDLGLGYGYGGYLNNMESGGQLSGSSTNKSDGVESLTLRGLQHLPSVNHGCHNARTWNHFAQDMSDVPHADAIPCSPPNLLTSVKKLHEQLFSFKDIMTTIAEIALGASPGSWHNFLDPAKGGLRFAYYPELQEQPAPKNIDYGAHADSGSMVFLRLDKDNSAGTEVFYAGQWLPVPHVPGGLVVNLGTVLARLTGGRWKAAIHRATRTFRTERLSLVLGGLVPNNNLMLHCLPGICENTSMAHRISVKEYLDARVRLQRLDQKPGDVDLVNFVDHLS